MSRDFLMRFNLNSAIEKVRKWNQPWMAMDDHESAEKSITSMSQCPGGRKLFGNPFSSVPSYS
jgi:hypothetical protein